MPIREIDRLPEPQDEWEQNWMEEVVEWLLRSQAPTRSQNAVNLYRDMQLAQEAVREEVLRG